MNHEKKKPIKHVFIYAEIHDQVKNEAKKAGMQITPFINELLQDALNYKNFLSKK